MKHTIRYGVSLELSWRAPSLGRAKTFVDWLKRSSWNWRVSYDVTLPRVPCQFYPQSRYILSETSIQFLELDLIHRSRDLTTNNSEKIWHFYCWKEFLLDSFEVRIIWIVFLPFCRRDFPSPSRMQSSPRGTWPFWPRCLWPTWTWFHCDNPHHRWLCCTSGGGRPSKD